MLKLLIAPLLLAFSANSLAYSFVTSNPTTQTVTGCGVVIDTAAKIDSPTETVSGGKRCKVDIAKVTSGTHTIKLTFFNIDPVKGRSESVFSAPFTFTQIVDIVLTAPTGLALTPQ